MVEADAWLDPAARSSKGSGLIATPPRLDAELRVAPQAGARPGYVPHVAHVCHGDLGVPRCGEEPGARAGVAGEILKLPSPEAFAGGFQGCIIAGSPVVTEADCLQGIPTASNIRPLLGACGVLSQVLPQDESA